MPKSSKGANGRASTPAARGSRSAGAGSPATKRAGVKGRWSADDRIARGRGAERPRGGVTRDRADDGRPNWEPRAPRDERAHRADRTAGGRSFRDDRAARPARDDRAQRPARHDAAERDQRPDRARWQDRAERPARDDRAGRDDRAPRAQYPDRDERADRTDRPTREDRPAREERGVRSDRAPRDDRAPREDRSANGDRGIRSDRAPRDDRNARPPRFDRDARPARDDRADRWGRDAGSPRDARPTRDDRAPRRDRPFRDDAPRMDRPRRDDRGAPWQRTDRPRSDEARGAARQRTDRPRYDGATASAPRTPHEDVVLERLKADAITAGEVDGVTFAALGLGDNIARVLADQGAVEPFPIQAATIPDVLAGRDVLGRGRTGSGKTIAFGAPLVERMLQQQRDTASGQRRRPGRAPRALILAPTRELALQIDRTVQPIAQSVGLFTTQLYGGVPYARQVGALQRGVDIVIGTPGRIEDLVEQGRLDLSQIATVVLDEADHMCDLGFLEPVQRLLRRTPDGGQRLLFSATLDTGVGELVEEFLREPAVHEVAGEDQDSSTIDHKVFLMNQRDKREVLVELAGGPGRKLVFARTRAFAEELTDLLEDEGIRAVSLHGDLNQSRRTRNLERLTSGRVDVLVATDVAARGIHVDDIALVIQADAPDEFKTYLHRSGRTGRAGREGTVVTLVPFNRRRRTEELLRRAEIHADWTEVAPGDTAIADLAERANA